MANLMQVRRGTAASATAVNPTLHQGEIGLETDTGKVKIGDGSTAWASLAYYESGVGSLAAADTSVVVGGTAEAPTVSTGTLDAIATHHPPAASVPMNGQKLTGLGSGSASGDSVAYGQLGSAAFQATSAFDASGAAATAQAAAEAASDPLGTATAAAAYYLRIFAA